MAKTTIAGFRVTVDFVFPVDALEQGSAAAQQAAAHEFKAKLAAMAPDAKVVACKGPVWGSARVADADG